MTFNFSSAIASALLLAIAAPAVSQTSATVVAAKQSGTVGERFDGYLGFAGAASDTVRRQVGAINIKRRSLYTDLAARRNATVQEVGIAAGCELLAGVNVGETYMLQDGKWRRRGAGQDAPVPGYCGK